MLSGATLSASAMAGTAVFRIVVSSDSMKKATATSHGNSRLLDGFTSIKPRSPFWDTMELSQIAKETAL